MNNESKAKALLAIITCGKILLTPATGTASLTPEFVSSAHAQEAPTSQICEDTDSGVVNETWTDDTDEEQMQISMQCGYKCYDPENDTSSDAIPARATFLALDTKKVRIYESDGNTTVSIDADIASGTAHTYLSEGPETFYATCAYDAVTQEISNCKQTKTTPLSEEEIETTTADLTMGCEGMIGKLSDGPWVPDGSTITYYKSAYAKKLLEQIKRDAAAIRSGTKMPSAPQPQ